MKQTFVEYKKLLIAFLFIAIPLMFVSVYRIEYSFTAPGYNDNIDSFIVINDALSTGNSFHTTSIVVVDKITITQYLIGSLEDYVTVKEFPKYYDDIDLKDLNIMGYLMKDDSLATSLVVGITNAGYEIDYDSYLTVYLTFDSLTKDSLELGDKILEINGNTNLEEALDAVVCGDLVEFKVLRDDEELVVYVDKKENDDGYCAYGMYLDYFTEINDTEVDYEIIDTNTGGPSGGLMQALFVYFSLAESDLESGLKIAGTGTIDVLGNVGYIGGVKQKIITASLNDIDIFFIPHLSDDEHDDYIEALEVYNTLDTDMILVGVSTFSEALEYLENYMGGE